MEWVKGYFLCQTRLSYIYQALVLLCCHRDGEKVVMSPLRDGSQSFVGLAFKLEVHLQQ